MHLKHFISEVQFGYSTFKTPASSDNFWIGVYFQVITVLLPPFAAAPLQHFFSSVSKQSLFPSKFFPIFSSLLTPTRNDFRESFAW
jgi:hypothetical protein